MMPLFLFSVVFAFSSFSHGAVQVTQTITVDQNGHGNFNNIQAAINSVPHANDKWIQIRIKAGIYK